MSNVWDNKLNDSSREALSGYSNIKALFKVLPTDGPPEAKAVSAKLKEALTDRVLGVPVGINKEFAQQLDGALSDPAAREKIAKLEHENPAALNKLADAMIANPASIGTLLKNTPVPSEQHAQPAPVAVAPPAQVAAAAPSVATPQAAAPQAAAPEKKDTAPQQPPAGRKATVWWDSHLNPLQRVEIGKVAPNLEKLLEAMPYGTPAQQKAADKIVDAVTKKRSFLPNGINDDTAKKLDKALDPATRKLLVEVASKGPDALDKIVDQFIADPSHVKETVQKFAQQQAEAAKLASAAPAADKDKPADAKKDEKPAAKKPAGKKSAKGGDKKDGDGDKDKDKKEEEEVIFTPTKEDDEIMKNSPFKSEWEKMRNMKGGTHAQQVQNGNTERMLLIMDKIIALLTGRETTAPVATANGPAAPSTPATLPSTFTGGKMKVAAAAPAAPPTVGTPAPAVKAAAKPAAVSV